MAVRKLIIEPETYVSEDPNATWRELTDAEKQAHTAGCSWKDSAKFIIEWEGCVLDLRERNMYHDSDFYAEIWDASRNDGQGGPRTVEYGTTRFPTYANDAVVDATEAARAAYKAWEAAYRAQRQAERDAAEAATPRAGKVVVVTGGRKLAKGTKATVFWYGVDKYNSNKWITAYRVGVKTEEGQKVFLSAEHVEVDQASTTQTWLNQIAAALWSNPNMPGNFHADDITMKLMEISGEWTELAPERCGKLDAAVELIDAGKDLPLALTLVKEALG